MKRIVSIVLITLIFTMCLSSVGFAEEKFEITMYVGEVIDLDSFLIENQILSAEENMCWTSGNERVVDINSSGRVEANEEGKSTIYARDKGNSSKIATIKIRVVSMVDDFHLKDEEISIKIVGIKEGKAKIHAKTVDGNKKDYVVVTVSGIKADILIDDSIDEVQVYVGGEHSFKATNGGRDVTHGVEWSSGLNDVLEIDDDGVAEGKEPGRTQKEI